MRLTLNARTQAQHLRSGDIIWEPCTGFVRVTKCLATKVNNKDAVALSFNEDHHETVLSVSPTQTFEVYSPVKED